MSLGPSPILLPDLASYSAVTKFLTKQFSHTSEIGKYFMEYWALITLVDTSQGIVSLIWGVGHPLTPFSRFLSTAVAKHQGFYTWRLPRRPRVYMLISLLRPPSLQNLPTYLLSRKS